MMKTAVLLLVVGWFVVGEALWPLPTSMQTGPDSVCVSSSQFSITSPCALVNDAINRYQESNLFFPVTGTNGIGYSVPVTVNSCIDKIDYGTDESYTLTLEKSGGKITAPTTYGAIRAIETLSQIFVYNSDGCYDITNLSLTIHDSPRFLWRGFMLDTARHYLSLDTIKMQLDAMSYAKYNVFHWHMIDAQSFPIIIEAQPALAKQGAYKYPEATYGPEDILDIVEFANARGIRVVAEMEVPGHAASWGKGHPEIVAHCPEYESNINNIPLNPSIQKTYEVVFAVLSQVSALVPDDWVHIGGDEVVYGCWFSDPEISAWADENQFDGNDIMKFFEDHVEQFLNILRRKRIVWEEVFLAGALSGTIDTIVQVWENADTMQKVVDAGYEGLQSYGWYLDKQIPSITVPETTHYEWVDTWQDMYSVEPTDNITGDLSLIIGGEGTMWAEQVNDETIMTRIWPRAGAVAERLWSAKDITDIDAALPRLEDFGCRLKRRGIASSPLQPGYCDNTTFFQYNEY